jgi:hypothetical protein
VRLAVVRQEREKHCLSEMPFCILEYPKGSGEMTYDKVYHAEYRRTHKEERKAYNKEHYQQHKEEIKAKNKAYNQQPKVIERHKIYHHKYHKDAREQLKAKLISYYSQGKNECACCGEKHIEFLSINHLNGGGNKHIHNIGAGNFYRWLKNNNFPNGYNVLCMNCNFALGHAGYCPHDKDRQVNFEKK